MSIMKDDYDRSVERVARSEDQLARLTGFGTTKQGRTLARQYCPQLADNIGTNRGSRAVRKALRGIKDEDLAFRLLVAGVSVCYAKNLGVDSDGQKNFRDIALWIGRNLGQRGKLGLEVGAWGINRLLYLPIFNLVDTNVLDIPLTDSLDALLNDVISGAPRPTRYCHPC
jgi:hypothetical protein